MNLDHYLWTPFLFLALVGMAALVFALPSPSKPSRWIVACGTLIVMIGLGLMLAGADGIQVSIFSSIQSSQNLLSHILTWIGWTIGIGLIIGIILLITVYLLSQKALPQVKARFIAEKDIPIWKRLVIADYSGILEEVIFRLCILSLIAWVIGLAWHAGLEQPSSGAEWAANFVAAVAFGLIHLPRWSAQTKLTSGLIITVIIINGLGSLAFGYLFFAHGIEAAILAHMVGDTVLHVIGPNYLSG